jgi:hypothetical protein
MSSERRPQEIRVRRRHAWTILFRADVTEEIAASFVATGRADFGQDWLNHVQITGPLCFYCEQDFRRCLLGVPG